MRNTLESEGVLWNEAKSKGQKEKSILLVSFAAKTKIYGISPPSHQK